tara:strand:+ start:5320 stop:6234 length:915 start_codon:yes stop_codon:yes gene_type:complete
MAGTHFKGAVKFSNATPALQNLNIGNWPDQVYYMDDFLDHVLNAGAAAGNFWSVINATNCPTTLATLANDGSLNGEAASIYAAAANNGTLIQSNMNYSTPSTRGERLYFECRTKFTTVTAGVFTGAPNTFWGLAEEGATRGSTFGAAVTSLIGFKSLVGGLQLTVCIKSPNGAEIQLTPTDANLVTLGTMAANTFVTLGFEVVNSPATVANNNIKTSSVNYYVNRQLYATCFSRTAGGVTTSQFVAGTQSSTAVAYDAFPATGTAAERMGMTWDIIATAAAGNTLTSDYFMASQDRGITYAPTN